MGVVIRYVGRTPGLHVRNGREIQLFGVVHNSVCQSPMVRDSRSAGRDTIRLWHAATEAKLNDGPKTPQNPARRERSRAMQLMFSKIEKIRAQAYQMLQSVSETVETVLPSMADKLCRNNASRVAGRSCCVVEESPNGSKQCT